MAYGSQLTVQPPVHALDVAVCVTDLTKMEQAELDAFNATGTHWVHQVYIYIAEFCVEWVYLRSSKLPIFPGRLAPATFAAHLLDRLFGILRIVYVSVTRAEPDRWEAETRVRVNPREC
jgi:hypothetical protein